ncbi:MAG: TIGR02449 family protein [Gammaproteobacteria bacterium]|nr:TIGR02449 family protein [Gammaproteobacteria bacterium]MCP5136987.1 TIGR02449 family protein [Gammaproteobacteria bacterium]
MSQHDAITQAEASLAVLQQKLERLLDQYHHLAQAHSDLRARHDALVHERAHLISNNEQAKHRVEAMLTRLKDLEPRA